MHKEECGCVELDFDPLVPITVGCKIHGYFGVTPLQHLVGYGCPICDQENPEELRQKLLRTFVQLMS